MSETQVQKHNLGAVQPRTKIDALKGIINADSVQEQFKNALDKNSGPFVASIIDLYNSDAGLQNCEPKGVVMEALKAAVLKLPINKSLGFAYIIAYNNSVKQPDGTWIKVPTPTFSIGYKGLIQLAMRTGQYRYLNADIVYEGELSHKNKLTGAIDFDGEPTSEKVVGYFCHFELLNGFSKTFYMTVEQVAKHAKKYVPSLQGKDQTTGKEKVAVEKLISLANSKETGKVGWEGNFTGMALKTVTRNLLSKYGYLSIEMQQAIVEDKDYDYEEARREELEKTGTKTLSAESVYFEEVSNPRADVDEGPKYE